MGIGPVPAIEALMKASSNTLPDVDIFDVRRYCCFCFFVFFYIEVLAFSHMTQCNAVLQHWHI